MANMNKEYALHTATSTADGLRQQLEEILSLDHPLKAYLAGGMATHLYTAHRVTTNVQEQFSGKIFAPRDLLVEIVHEDGSHQAVYLDTSGPATTEPIRVAKNWTPPEIFS